ncbi:hypothetical protein AB0M02_36010 [Actinoplanes sp. NPDC051861]|uniref:hypothetical protein n=1 Tax=Actinoplanes sp. NPDC051861 TaxID=3155170 RepID=UPI0034485360
MRNLGRLAATACALALAVAGLAAPPAHAAPPGSTFGADPEPVPGGFASWSELFTTQDRMNVAGARVTAAGRADERSGYAGVIADPATRELRVYWKGAAPAGLSARVRSSVPMRVLPALYSERDLQAAAERLLARAGDQVTMVGPRADGSGLLVGTDGAAIPAARYAGVPVTLETNVKPVALTRVNDAPPWSGGARWQNATRGGSCSTGFGVVQAGVNRVLTAAHCGEPNHLAEDPTGQDIGRVGTEDDGNDVMVINGNSQGRVYLNTFDSLGRVVQEFSSPVVGTRANQVGNILCTSGSFSGSRCRVSVSATGLCINLSTPAEGTVRVCGQVRADQLDGLAAAGEGDSGGPVVSFDGAGTGRVLAHGTISGGSSAQEVTCRGYDTSDRNCSSRIFFEDITTGLAEMSATILLG